MVKKFEGVGKPRLAATTSLFGLLGSQDEFLDPTGSILAGQTGPGRLGTIFDKHRSASTSIKSRRPHSVPVEDCSRNVGSLKRSTFKFRDRKSTRLNSSHLGISYAVFC